MKRSLVLLLILLGVGCSRARPVPPTPTPTPTLVATPTLAPTFTPTLPPYITYTVEPGDNPWSIALEFGVTVEALMEANGFSEDTILDVGQEVLIPLEPREEATPQPTSSPQGLIYTVRAGDSLWSIALEFGVTVEALMEANGLSEDTILDVGQELIIPQD